MRLPRATKGRRQHNILTSVIEDRSRAESFHIQCITDRASQGRELIGFAQDRKADLEGVCRFGITACQPDGNIRVFLIDSTRQRHAIQFSRHDNIREHEINSLARSKESQRRSRRLDVKHSVAELLQQHACDFLDLYIILD